jgi:hypothetical protein
VQASLPKERVRSQQNRDAASARLKDIRHKTHQLRVDTTRMMHENELVEVGYSACAPFIAHPSLCFQGPNRSTYARCNASE